MHTKKDFRPWAVCFFLMLPLIFGAGNAGAAVYTFDGALHDAATGAWAAPNFADTYCAAPPKDPATGSEWDGETFNGVSGAVPNAVKRIDLAPQQCNGPATSSQVIAGVFTGSYSVSSSHVVSSTPGPIAAVGAAFPAAGPAAKADCIAAGYTWSVNLADPLRSTCKAFSWEADVASGSTSTRGPGGWYGENRQGCLRCHNTSYMSAMNGVYPSKGNAGDISSFGKEASLLGGHRNMSRPADGLPWGMPGVDAGHPASPWLSGASLDNNGFFSALWIQEDYPKMLVNWSPASVSLAYCAKDATGAIGTADVPDLKACPTCGSPVMGNGAAGYPLNYPDQATCEAAKKPGTGAPGYVWYNAGTQPLYWIYGGAGLEGGPAMMQRGSQQYKCGRCHTTGWTANTSADDISAKHPQSDFPAVDFKTLTAVGGATLLLNPSTAGSAASDVSSWDQWGIECSRCHQNADGSHDQWPTSATTGGDVVALCMNCHRQESDTMPRVNANQNNYTANTNAATVFTNKQQQPDGFAHHPDGNEYLNSPHAKFTGTWGQIGCPPYAINGYGASITPYAPGKPAECAPGAMNLTGPGGNAVYASNFAYAAKADLGVSDTAAGSCVTCHDVHKPRNENTAGMGAGATAACSDCHMKGPGSVSPQVNLSIINHPGGPGTPLENAATDPSSACIVCHQPAGIKHIWRINTDAHYTTYGNYSSSDLSTGPSNSTWVNPSNTTPADRRGVYANPVWVDLDSACGQCHGGGVSRTDISTQLTVGFTGRQYGVRVGSTRGFEPGKELTIQAAGQDGGDFKTVIASVSTPTVYLTYPTPAAGTGYYSAIVTASGNPTTGNASYKTRAQLSFLARNMHSAEPKAYFTWRADPAANLKVNFDALGSYCPPAASSCTYGWDFGDGQSATGVTTASHLYSSQAGTVVTLSVSANGLGTMNTYAIRVTPKYVGAANPISLGTPTVLVSGFRATFTDVSSGGSGTVTVRIGWGDGRSDTIHQGDTISHVYPKARPAPMPPYRVLLIAADSGVTINGIGGRYRSIVNNAKGPLFVTIYPFSLSGLVTNNTGTAVPYVIMTLKQGTKTVRRVQASPGGLYTFSNVVPELVSGPTTSSTPYTVVASKYGYTFSPYTFGSTIDPASSTSVIPVPTIVAQ
jgi:5-methylcytosine-specific restriction endonuclease McrA